MATDLTPSVPITSIPPHSDDTPTSTIPTAITTKPVGFLAYTNGSTPIKRHTTTHLTPKHEPPPPRTMISTTTTTVSYKECMRNHAATIGGHALDGCCEFMPSPESNPAEPTSLVCAACGCHRNFHRRDPDDPTPLHQKHHPHPHPPPSHPHLNPRTPPPESPLPPPTSTFYSSAPHFHHHLTPLQNNNLTTAPSPVAMASAPPNGTRKLKLPLISDRGSGGDGSGRISRKRFRTKFTREQKERMQGFAERMGWKMQKIDRRVVEEFCEEIGVGREVLKVWMHNNKNVFVRNRDEISGHSHGLLHNGNNNNNRQVTGGTTSTTAVVGGGGDKIIGNGGGDRIIHGLFYSTSSSNGGDADGGGGAGVKVERMDMTVGRGGDDDDGSGSGSGGDDDDGSGSGSGGSHRSNGVDRFEHFQVVSADGSASSSSSG